MVRYHEQLLYDNKTGLNPCSSMSSNTHTERAEAVSKNGEFVPAVPVVLKIHSARRPSPASAPEPEPEPEQEPEPEPDVDIECLHK